ncbi:unnamed protein product [Timema podura]|uniref:Uncharacterized protein n=1 Tax=Timema podura TaxID=61482 RepID=A0ABN7NEQ2_TIMPD|nr:unnamed protein product [Timema podura]
MRIWSIPVEGSGGGVEGEGGKETVHKSPARVRYRIIKVNSYCLQKCVKRGCGLTFMFIITMLVLTIGRTHLKRFLISPPALRCGTTISPQRVNRSTRHHHGLQDVPLYELDCFPNHSLNNCSPSLLSVSYNVPNDINFVGRPVDPPPYCEVLSSPPREGPPPPYASQDNLSIDIREREADSESSSGEADSLLDSTQTSVCGEHVSYVLSNTTLPITAAAAAESSEVSEFSTTLEKLVDKVCKCNMPNSTHCHDCETQTNDIRVASQRQGSPPPYLSQKNLLRDIRERNSDSDCSISEANSLLDLLQPSFIREHTVTPSTLPLVTAATRNLEISQTPANLGKLNDKQSNCNNSSSS